jgi:hypothetical protein
MSSAPRTDARTVANSSDSCPATTPRPKKGTLTYCDGDRQNLRSLFNDLARDKPLENGGWVEAPKSESQQFLPGSDGNHSLSQRRRRLSTPSPQELLVIWATLHQQYFPDHEILAEYNLSWSTRPQKRVLASCDIIGKRVRVARELARPEYGRYLPPLLYHEMCHAVIGREVETRNGARLWHGPRFRELESNHPDSLMLQAWITEGGWATAVRRDRAFAAASRRKNRE